MRFNPTLVLSTSALALTIGLATPAFAQDSGGSQSPDPACANLPEGDARDRCISGEVEIESGQATEPKDTIVVTGSRIRRPNVESNVPITSVSAEDLTSQGDVNVGDALNDLPALRSTFSQANSTRFIGTAGVNLLDLRGLGTSRTLVLVNGRRHVTYSPGDFLVDVNTIPSDLIERVDVVTGGSSAVYGSDAVAGVVNFVLKRDFDGVRIKGQAGISDEGDRGIQFVTLTAGENFANDRANVAINLEYVNAEPLYFYQRPRLTGAFDGRCQFNTSEPTGGETNGTDGIPDQTFNCGTRNVAIADGGTLTANISTASCQNPAFGPSGVNAAIGAARCLNPGTSLGAPRFFNFAPDGSLVQQIPVTDFRPFGPGNYVAAPGQVAPGSTLRNTGQLAPGLDRKTANVLASFEITPAFRPFVEAKFVRLDAVQEGQPSFVQLTFPQFFGVGSTFPDPASIPRGIRCDNPFLTADNIATLRTVGRCTGTTPTALGNETLPVGRFNVDFGGRSEIIRRDTWRIVGGIGGEFNTDWNYEVSLNYGKMKSRQDEHNDLVLFDLNGNLDGFLLATDAVRDPNTGQIVCRVNSTSAVQDPGGAANNRPDCVPINLLGFGRPSQAALDFVNTTSFVKSRASQLDALAFVSGDMSQLFELPGGPIRFVVGGEYRKETAHRIADPLSASGGTFFNAFQEFDPPAFKVKEVFGELELPILKDLPFAEELTVTGAGRFSDYNTAANKTFAYNVNGTWAPIRDLRFRANYSKSVRVPTLGDLFTPPTQNFAFVADPCDFRRITAGGSNREANCRALGVPVGFDAVLTNSQTAEIISSGNPNLTEETGKSLTLGAVFTPRWVPGLSLTIDYYKIKVENLIATLGAQTILNQCVDLPSVNNQFCQVIFPRLTVDDPGTPNNEIGALASPALISGGINFARQDAKGIDFELAYRKTFANGHRLNFRGIATRVLERTNYTSPTDPNFGDRILGELGDPKWAANANVTYGIGRFDLRYSMNFFGKGTIGTYESYFEFEGRPPTNPDLTEEVYYPSALYHAVRLNTKVAKKFNFYIGVDNLFDKKPPLGLLGTGGGDPYDTIGRYLYAGATVDF
ncbi:MAG TPA: TonB-dependent receptor [Sphingomicrobium sp.]|nr:TonB-dependent receptor [Sphingomicrobium sp.]